MAYVLSQMPVHCGPVQLLKEPDVLPKFKYLFENEHRPTTKEDPEMTFNVEPQVNSEGEQLLDVDSCEKSVANSDVKPELNSDEEDVIVIDPVPINPCEDPETTSEVKTQVKSDDIIRQLTIDGLIIMSSAIIDVVSREGRETTLDVKTLVNSEEGVIDIVSNCEEFKTNYDIKPDVSSEEKDIDVVPCKESKTNCDVKPEVSSEEEDIIEVVSCEELTVNHVDIPEENHSREEVTAPVPCKDFEEPVVISDDGATPKCKPRIQEISIPLEKLRVTTNCINKRLELEEDEYIFCSQCDKLRIGDCSIHGSLRWEKEPAVVFKKEGLTKARSTIPSNMDLKTSSIPDAGLGIFAKERFESDVVFGPYGGEKIDVADVAPNMDQSYMWDIIENGRVTHVVDARDEKHSNWLRFVNCARNDDEQNLVAFQFRGEIYYRSYKAIEPGTELLVWYGDKYACDLDILNKDESKKIADGPIQCQKCFMVCSGPFSFANHNKFRCQMNSEHHLWRCMHCDRSFKTQFSLHLHQNIHKGLRPFTCRICGKGFSHPSSRNRHYNLHFAKHPLHCKMCVQGFGDKNSLRRHERTFHAFKRLSDGKFECLECQKLFGTWKSLRQHKKHVRHTDADASNCKANSKLFKKRQNFLRHEALHKPYKCQQCGLFFLSRIGLSNHKRSHLNKTVNESKTRCQNGLTTAHYVCQICRSGFKYSQNLDRHIRQKHPSVKGIKCGKCSKVCLDKHRLALHNAIRHARNDSRLKTHRLQQEQGNKQGLVDSKARVNMDATIQRAESENAMETSEGKYLASSNHPQDQTVFNSKEFRCEFCAKGFPSLSLMHRHRASHFRKKHPMLHVPVSFGMSSMVPPKETPRRDGTVCSKRKFKCEVCCKSFSSSKGLHSHRGSHFRRKNCEHCNKSFYTMKLLWQHNCCRVDNSPNSTTFHCKVCNKSFLKETSLLSHMTHHSRNPSPSSSVLPPPSPLPKCSPESSKLQAEDKSFKCDICAREFISKKSLNSHKSYHTRCGEKWFPSGRAWQQRQKSPHGQGSFSFSSRPSDSKKSVLSASDQKQFRCEVCGKGFCFRESLNRHKGQHSKACTKQSFPSHRFSKKTKPNVDGTFRCKVCKKSFLKETSLRSHMTHHSRNPSQSPPPNSLPKCSPESSKLQAEDKSFKCDICAREFVSKDSLNAHKSHHARFGNKWFLSRPLLQPRRKSPHGQGSLSFSSPPSDSKKKVLSASDQKQFRCEACGKAFRFRESLNRHKGQHREKTCAKGSFPSHRFSKETKPKVDANVQEPHVCKVCYESFPSNRSLAQHKRSHAGISTAYTCAFCHKGFSFKHNLLRHKQRQHKERPYKCQQCGEGFRTVHGRLSHLTLNHSTVKPEQKYSSASKAGQPKSEAFKICCLHCDKRFMTCNGRYKHMRNCHNDSTMQTKNDPCKCPYCSKEFQTGSDMSKHVKKNHAKKKKFGHHQRCKQEGKASVETTSHNGTQTYCSEGFHTDSSVSKHVKKNHAKKKKFDHHQRYKQEGKASVETTSHDGTQTYCSEGFHTDSSVSKHVKKNHAKKKKFDHHQRYKQEGKASVETTSHQVADGTQRCRRCKGRFFASGSDIKHSYCIHCSRELSLEGNANGSGNFLDEKIQSICEKKNCLNDPVASGTHTARAFHCQYCLKGFFTVNCLYKHIMIVHDKDFGRSNPHYPSKRLDNQSVSGYINTIHQAGTTQGSRETIENSDKAHESGNNVNAQLRGEKFTTVKKKLCRTKTKRTHITCRFQCRYCRSTFFTKSSRRKHETKLHEKQVGSPSVWPKLDVKCGTNKPFPESVFSSEDDLSALQSHEVISSRRAFTDTPHAKACHARNKAFLCEYCPKQFVRISSRYKHAMLAHSRAARLTPKAGSTGETVLSWNDRSTNSLVTPTKRKATMSSPDCQPEGKKFRRNEINFELKTKLEQSEFLLDATSNESVSRAHYRDPSRQHGFSCGSRSRTSTQQGFVYSETKLANKPSQSLFDATGNESVSTSHHSDQARQHGFSSQSEILEQCSSIPDNFSEVLSVSGADSEPYERGTCYATLRTKGDWTKHVHETHNGDANEVVCSIDDRVGLSRPALRTISSSLQNSNKLKSLRNRHNSRTTEITYDKQVKVPSMRQCKFVKQTSSLKTALNEKRFECDICHSWFRERCTMFRHKLSRHNDERPFQCDSCGYAAKRKDGLDSHYARAHCS